jgi:hypothetical protein
VHDCVTRLESLCDDIESTYRPQARFDMLDQPWYWTRVPACTRYLVAVIGEEGGDRPPDLTGGSGKEYSHFSIP